MPLKLSAVVSSVLVLSLEAELPLGAMQTVKAWAEDGVVLAHTVQQPCKALPTTQWTAPCKQMTCTVLLSVIQ